MNWIVQRRPLKKSIGQVECTYIIHQIKNFMQAKVLREISPHKFPWRSARERVGGSSAHIYARPHRHKSSLQKIFGFIFLEPACATKKSKKTLLFLSRRFAPHSKISHLFKPVLFGLHYTTKSEPFSNLNVSARSTRLVM